MGKVKSNQPTTKTSGRQPTLKTESDGSVKKPFDKAKWREQKYSNKAKINRFEERRRKNVLREYYKEVKKLGGSKNGSQGQNTADNLPTNGSSTKKSLKPYEMARMEAERLRQEKENKRLQKQRILDERKSALAKYKEKKKDRFSKLSKKTQKGQPVMAGRMELLLEKIQKGM